MEAARNANVTVTSLSVQSTTLDDVFVHYTGHQLRDALQAPGGCQQPVSDAARIRGQDDMHRIWAIIERDLRRFRRSPVLVIVSIVMPLVQLVVLGLRVRRQRQAPESRRRRPGPRRAGDQTEGNVPGRRRQRAHLRHRLLTATKAAALRDLRNGKINGVLTFRRSFRARSSPERIRASRWSKTTPTILRVRARRQPQWHACALQWTRRSAAHDRGGDALRRGDLSVRALHPVPAARHDRAGDLCFGHDRRRHHFHRRQGARPARGLSRHADPQI